SRHGDQVHYFQGTPKRLSRRWRHLRSPAICTIAGPPRHAVKKTTTGDNTMKQKLRYFLAALACTLAWAPAQAQTPIPSQITIVVPFGAGASNDSIARVIAPELA